MSGVCEKERKAEAPFRVLVRGGLRLCYTTTTTTGAEHALTLLRKLTVSLTVKNLNYIFVSAKLHEIKL